MVGFFLRFVGLLVAWWVDGWLFLEGEYLLPVVLHADHCPAVLLRLVIESLWESADLRVRQTLRRAIGIFALCVVVQDEHRESRAVAGLGVFQHLLVAGGVAKCRVRAAADHQVDAFGFATVVVVEQQLGVLGQERFALLVIAICRAAHGADDLFRRDSIGLLGIHAHEILAAAGADVSLVAIGAEILQHFLHRQVGHLIIGLVPARVFGVGEPLLHLGLKLLRG